MGRTTRIIVIVSIALLVSAIVFFVVKANLKPTDQQFADLKKAMEEAGSDLLDYPVSETPKILESFKANLSRSEADKMIELISKMKSDKSAETQVIILYQKMLRSYKK